MGYRVGGQCFATSEEASDHKMSMIVPTITADGSLKMPIRKTDGWYYGSNKIQLTHPECDQTAALKEGIQIGIIIASLFAIAAIVKAIKTIIVKYNERETE